MRNSTEHYGSLSIALHWLMLLILVAVYMCIELREFYPKGSDIREGLKSWHFMLGLSVFALIWVRIYARLSTSVLPIAPALAPLQNLSAKLIHIALYLFMIAMPLLGWLLLSASGKPIPFFGLELPALVAKNKGLADLIKDIHETGGTIGYVLVGFHVAAALFHHYYVKDNTLLRMLPKRD